MKEGSGVSVGAHLAALIPFFVEPIRQIEEMVIDIKSLLDSLYRSLFYNIKKSFSFSLMMKV
jgi:hypothetical protein